MAFYFRAAAARSTCGQTAPASVEPQLADMARVLRKVAALDRLDDLDQAFVGPRLDAGPRPFAHDEAVEKLDFGTAALGHVLAHRRALVGGAARRVEAVLVVVPQCRGIALAGAGDHLRIEVADLFELVAERLADADRLAAQPRLEMADRLVPGDLGPAQPGAGGDAVRHRVGELRPALAPQIVGCLGAVGMADEPAHLLRALGDAPVHLAGTVDGVAAAADQPAAVHLPRRMQGDADVASDAAQRPPPADDLGDRRLVHAVLQRHDIAGRRQVLLDQPRRPFGVVGFDADEGDVDRLLLGELLRLGQVQGADLDVERLRPLVVGDADAVPVDRLDIFRPEVDEGDVFPGLRHMLAGIADDRPRADDDDPLAHGDSPGRWLLCAIMEHFIPTERILRCRSRQNLRRRASPARSRGTGRWLRSARRTRPGGALPARAPRPARLKLRRRARRTKRFDWRSHARENWRISPPNRRVAAPEQAAPSHSGSRRR